MPIKKAAFKHLRQTKRRTVKNRAEKARVRTLTKTVVKALEQSKTDDAQQRLREALKAIDKAAQHGVIKKNAAARKKSRLMRRWNAAAKPAASSASR